MNMRSNKTTLLKAKKKKGRSTKRNGFRSIFEDSIDKNISKQIKNLIGYESEKLDYVIHHTYNPDFIISGKDGKKIYVEAKGFFDVNDRRKILAVIKCHPNIDLRMIFQNPNNKISKNSKITYSKWCEKNGINWSQNISIINQWYKEIN